MRAFPRENVHMYIFNENSGSNGMLNFVCTRNITGDESKVNKAGNMNVCVVLPYKARLCVTREPIN